MSNKYSQHFLMNTDEVKNYAREVLDFFDEDAILDSCEIGDGNINYVFKVWDTNTGKSVIIKQADKLLRSSGRPLDLNRNKIEANILKIQGSLAPQFVPKVYYYDENMYALSMEDISEYKNLRTEMLKGKTFPHFADEISEFLVRTLLPTTDLVLDRGDKKKYVKEFVNPELCDITEDLVFTEPYYNYKNRNIVTEGNEDFVQEKLYSDQDLHCEIGKLRCEFMNNSQALIHGDLHTGSIFVNKNGTKVIDPEFAFYGPMAYDIGNVIGNLFFAWANRYYTNPQDEHFLAWVENTIIDFTTSLNRKLSDKFDRLVEFKLYNSIFKEQYINQILKSSVGYAGTEIIRRVVGDAKVLELTSVTDFKIKIPMERSLINTGITFIKNRQKLVDGAAIVDIFKCNLADTKIKN